MYVIVFVYVVVYASHRSKVKLLIDIDLYYVCGASEQVNWPVSRMVVVGVLRPERSKLSFQTLVSLCEMLCESQQPRPLLKITWSCV